MDAIRKKELIPFGVYLSKLREKSGFKTKSELAKASGISIATISRIESGIQRANPETLKALAEHLKGVVYEDLLEKLNYIEAKEKESNTSPQIKNLAITLQRARNAEKLSDEDLDYIVEQVERLIDFAERKNN
jgi:transcriptional regulator with XRE-family HTH domain